MKQVVTLLIVTVLLSVLATLLCHSIFKDYQCEYYNHYNKEHILYRYNQTVMGNVVIPENVTVYFSDDIKSCNDYNKKFRYQGVYYAKGRIIFILDSLSDKLKEDTLVHELSHDSWVYTISDDYKNDIKDTYSYVCQSPNEFNAFFEQCRYNLVMDGLK